MRSATILASTATRTDGLSKTAFVLGAEEAMEIYDRLDDVDAILVTPDGQVLYSKGLEPLTAQDGLPLTCGQDRLEAPRVGLRQVGRQRRDGLPASQI